MSGNVEMRFNSTLAHPDPNHIMSYSVYDIAARSCSVCYLRDHPELSAEIDMDRYVVVRTYLFQSRPFVRSSIHLAARAS